MQLKKTEEDNTFGHLINHSKSFQNVEPYVGHRDGTPFIYFVDICDIQEHQEILYDYGNNASSSQKHLSWVCVHNFKC